MKLAKTRCICCKRTIIIGRLNKKVNKILYGGSTCKTCADKLADSLISNIFDVITKKPEAGNDSTP